AFGSLKYANLVHQITINHGVSVPNEAFFDAAIIMFFHIVAVYTVVGWFLEKFFHKKRYMLFFLATFSVLVVSSFLAIWVKELYTQWFFNPDFQSYYLTAVLGNLVDTFIVTIILIVVYLSAYYYRKNQ